MNETVVKRSIGMGSEYRRHTTWLLSGDEMRLVMDTGRNDRVSWSKRWDDDLGRYIVRKSEIGAEREEWQGPAEIGAFLFSSRGPEALLVTHGHIYRLRVVESNPREVVVVGDLKHELFAPHSKAINAGMYERIRIVLDASSAWPRQFTEYGPGENGRVVTWRYTEPNVDVKLTKEDFEFNEEPTPQVQEPPPTTPDQPSPAPTPRAPLPPSPPRQP